MAKYEFSIRYSGEALLDGRVPIKDLAPSLLSLSEAFQEVQRINYPNQQPVSLDIKATDKGSFIVDLILANGSDLLKHTIDLLNGNESAALQSLIAITGGVVGSIAFATKVGKKIIKSKKELPSGDIKITLDDETSITASKEAFEAYKNIEFRKSIKEFVRPLESQGINRIEFSKEKEVSVTISKNDIDSFYVPPSKDKELPSSESEVYLQIINISFANEKWKLTSGDKPFWASIADKDFLTAVENNQQQFGANDTLQVRLLTEQRITENGLKAEYTVLKVLDHIKGARQIELDLDDE